MTESLSLGLVRRLARQASLSAGRALLVGGAVRDSLLGAPVKDLDIELFGVAPEAVEELAEKAGARVERVGRSFPVWKAWIPGMTAAQAVDIALPRREKATGTKHTDFAYVLDPTMSFAEAALRRDFTFNAMGLDPLSGELIDPYGGANDLRAGRLRATSEHFAEDPLRVLRGAQFCGRFGLKADAETLAMCQKLSPASLSRERIWDEWKKLILKSVQPSLALEFLREADWLKHFPELAALPGVRQSPRWHPEGDVWAHTKHCMDAYAAKRTGDPEDDLVVGLATLCHDLGKPATTRLIDGDWRALGHEGAGATPTASFLGRMTDERGLIADVQSLVVAHMIPVNLHQTATEGGNMDRAVRRLSTKARLDRLARVVAADHSGRPPLPPDTAAADWLLARAERLHVTKGPPAPLVRGRDLMALGVAPGPEMGNALKEVYRQQIEGTVKTPEEALAAAEGLLAASAAKRLPPDVERALWFSGSKVVEGNPPVPKMVFHGGLRFEQFSANPAAGAHYATDSIDVAGGYAGQYRTDEAEIRPLWLVMRNPLDLRNLETFKRWANIDPATGPFHAIERNMAHESPMGSGSKLLARARSAGHDGVIFFDTGVDNKGLHTSYAFFRPEQARVATEPDLGDRWWDYSIRQGGEPAPATGHELQPPVRNVRPPAPAFTPEP